MRIGTLLIVIIAVLLTVVAMQNANNSADVDILFFSYRKSTLFVVCIAAIPAFIAGFLTGRPRRTKLSNDYGHGYDETDPNAQRVAANQRTSNLSDEDRDYISED